MDRGADRGLLPCGLGAGWKERVVLALVLLVVLWWVSTPRQGVPKPQVDTKPGLQIDDGSKVGLPIGETNAETVLALDPAEQRVGRGAVFSLSAIVETGSNRVSGAELAIRFDPRQVRLERVVASNIFSLELQAPVINNTNGTGSIALGIPLDQPSVSGRQSVVTFTFRATDALTEATIELTDHSIVAADGEPGSVIRERQSARVFVAPLGQ